MKIHIGQGIDYSGFSYLGEEITLNNRDMKETVEFFQENHKNTENYEKKDSKYHTLFLSSPKFPSSKTKETENFEKLITEYMKEVNKLGENIM